MTDKHCSSCGGERNTKGWYCRDCRKSYMRAWRAKESREIRRLRQITKGLLRESVDWTPSLQAGKG